MNPFCFPKRDKRDVVPLNANGANNPLAKTFEARSDAVVA
jgi:hypothetical protein